MRNPEYRFVDDDAGLIIRQLTAIYEDLTKSSVRPASPEQLFIRFVGNVIVQERALTNYAGNQNLPSRAEGESLDALSQLFMAAERPEAVAAVSTQRFYIEEPQPSSLLIPKGTRVTGESGSIMWETSEDAYVGIGSTYVDVPIQAQEKGTAGNGYIEGQINKIVDVNNVPYCTATENTTVSGMGADRADDDTYYEIIRRSMDALSTAGASESYVYHAKKVSVEIADVVPNSPGAGRVCIYTLMNDGTPAGDEIKQAVLEACNEKTARPLTDYVTAEDPETVPYEIDFTYYIPSKINKSQTEIAQEVEAAVEEYVKWQRGAFGRDINPDELRQRVKAVGVKRIEITAPEFAMLHRGDEKPVRVPQVAVNTSINVVNGGFEDE